MDENSEVNVNGLKISFRRWRTEDASDLAKVLNKKKLQDNMLSKMPLPYTEKDAAAQIKSVLSANKDLYYIFAIVHDRKVIGSIGVRRLVKTIPATGEIGYFLAEAYWGKGIATESIRQICGYIFEKTDITRIFAKSFSANIASCRALEKTGFVFEYVRKVNKNEQTMDLNIYAINN